VNNSVTDEIKNYVDCRYIGAMEAVWQIFHFPLHDQHPAVQSLQVHLEHQQSVIFQDGPIICSVVWLSRSRCSWHFESAAGCYCHYYLQLLIL